MKSITILFALLVASLATAGDEAWPGKGDTVYISASFKKLSAPSPVAGTTMQYDMPPCAELAIVKADPKKLRWVTKDPVGGTEQLEGEWLQRMHRSKAECEGKVSADGEPNVEHAGGKFKIAPVIVK